MGAALTRSVPQPARTEAASPQAQEIRQPAHDGHSHGAV